MASEFFALGSRGLAVGEVHQRLLENGYDLAVDELKSGSFGFTTDEAVKRFQACHVDAHGKDLKPDGIVGDRTLWALSHPSGPQERFTAEGWRIDSNKANSRVRPALLAAVGDIGKREDYATPNDGPQIRKFFPTDAERGLPWCAYAVSHWLKYCDGGSPLYQPLASAYKWRQYGIETNRIFEPSKAEAGDVFVILREGGHGHVGLVVTVNDDASLSTVEGNCGNAVRGVVRRYQTFTCVVRPCYP